MLYRFARSFSLLGLLLGMGFFCASLTPSLLPRNPYVQGVLAGAAGVVGYWVGWATVIFWHFLEVPMIPRKIALRMSFVLALGLAALCAYTLGRMAVWQNVLRDLMEMSPVDSGFPFSVLGIAIVTALLIFLISRATVGAISIIARRAQRVFPRRISYAIGIALVLLTGGFLVNGVILQAALRSADDIFAAINQNIDQEVDRPSWFDSTDGAPIRWDEVGRHGQGFLTGGPTAADLKAFSGRKPTAPVRVYVGYETAETPEERAKVALNELIEAGGFERSVLVVATPTGTGWLDPSAMQPLVFMHNGDVAIVATQYSYLPSWLTLLIDPDRSRREARALFGEIYNYWEDLDPETRPEFYLFGLSLGALGSEASASFWTLLSDPIHGALWSGPPFASTLWPQIVAGRNDGSAPWLPIFQDSEVVRFLSNTGFAVPEDTPWGALRVVYLQHASDPMSYFSPSLAFNAPAWLGSDRGPDVSPYFQWFPLVTFLQVAFDIPMATTVPSGYGHSFSPASYIDGWRAVTNPRDWTAEDTRRLKVHFEGFDASPL